MNDKEIVLMTKLKEILNEAGYNVNTMNFFDEHLGNMKYVSAINIRARKKEVLE